MGYATVVDVETYAPARAPFTANTKPSATVVAELIRDANAQVDRALIEGGYSVPVATTATVAYQIVKSTEAKVAAAMVEAIAPQSDRETRSAMMANEALKALRAGEVPGLAKDGGSSSPRWRPDVATTALFSRDMDL